MIHGSWLPATLVHKCTTSPRELLELTGAFSRCVIVAVRAVTVGLSRRFLADGYDWQLHPVSFRYMDALWGPRTVNWFAADVRA
jgi:hypothetical protein